MLFDKEHGNPFDKTSIQGPSSVLLKRVLPGLAVMLLAVGCAQESSQEPSRQYEEFYEDFSQRGKLIESAIEECSAEEVYPIGCAPSSWHVCFAQLGGGGRGFVAGYLCDAAVIAEAGELAFALAYRYGREFYPRVFIGSGGRFTRSGEPPVFYLFHASLDYWLSHLGRPVEPVTDYISSVPIDFGWLRSYRGSKPFGGFYSEASEAELAQLESLEEAIAGLYSPYNAHDPSELNWHINSPDLSSFEAADPTASSLVPPAEVARVCQDAMTAARLDDTMWRTGIQQCLASAEACGKDDDETKYRLRRECSEAASAADFESRWQMLPYVCLAAGKVTDMDSADDPCREAAGELCYHPHRQYQGFSLREAPDNPAEDFTCAAAGIDPLLFFQQPPPAERDTAPIANDDKILGGLDSWIRIDVLANDANVRGDLDSFTLGIVESKRPRRGIARVIHIPQGLPVIEYHARSRFFSAGEHDTFSYAICDDLRSDFNRCNTAEVTVFYPYCTITGTPGNDSLVGTPGVDVICGLDGDDIITGQAGNDLIYADGGADIIYSGTGDDTIFGGPGNDLIFGHRGHDTLYGGPGEDRLHGDEGGDTLHGGDGNDTIRSGEGADIIYPSTGIDTILDTSEEDVIY